MANCRISEHFPNCAYRNRTINLGEIFQLNHPLQVPECNQSRLLHFEDISVQAKEDDVSQRDWGH